MLKMNGVRGFFAQWRHLGATAFAPRKVLEKETSASVMVSEAADEALSKLISLLVMNISHRGSLYRQGGRKTIV